MKSYREENLEAIGHLLEAEEDRLSDWEVTFLQDLKSYLEDDGQLSEKQEAKLDDIWQDIVVDRRND